MSESAIAFGREVYCAVCGYDLRAAVVGGRCPECGAAARGAARSRLPWVHRKYRGSVRAYLQTVGVVMFRPWVLAREVEGRVGVRDGLVFHRVSVVLATVIGLVLLGITFGVRGWRWIRILSVKLPTIAVDATGMKVAKSAWGLPVNVLSDGWWILLPLGVSIYLTLMASMWVYRWFLGVFSGGRRHRKRVRRIGLYMSGALPALAIVFGLMSVGGMLLSVEPSWMMNELKSGLTVMMAALCAIVLTIFYAPTWVVVTKTGTWRVLRFILMFPIFGFVAMLVGAAVSLGVFWGMGYLALAISSMTR